MPLDVEVEARGPPSRTEPDAPAFATILGGVVILIGTPPNITASAIRMEYLGAPYRMFDFTPVGLVIVAVRQPQAPAGSWEKGKIIDRENPDNLLLPVQCDQSPLLAMERGRCGGGFGCIVGEALPSRQCAR